MRIAVKGHAHLRRAWVLWGNDGRASPVHHIVRCSVSGMVTSVAWGIFGDARASGLDLSRILAASSQRM